MLIFADMIDKYKHLLSMPRWEPMNHQRMALEKRAAQFASFAALSGHDEAIAETARLTASHPDPELRDSNSINARLAWLLSQAPQAPTAVFTYFKPDEKKEGGSISKTKGEAKRLDEENMALMLTDGRIIPLDDIIAIDSEAFNDIEEFWD